MRLRLSLFSKVFLSLLLATILIVGGMVILVNWSFRTGFTAYHHQVEQERAVLFTKKLSEAYGHHGKSWDFIRYDHREWGDLLRQIGEPLPKRGRKKPLRKRSRNDNDYPRRPPPSERYNDNFVGDRPDEHRLPRRDYDPNEGNRGGRPPHDNDFYYRDPYQISSLSSHSSSVQAPNQPIILAENETTQAISANNTEKQNSDETLEKKDKKSKNKQQRSPKSFGARLVLLDAKERVVIGDRRNLRIQPDSNSWINKQAIQYQQETVGWLVLRQGGQINNGLANSFVQQQMSNLYLVASLALITSFALALLLVRQLLRPVRLLTNGTEALMAGQFATRIPITTHDELGDLANDFNALAATLAENETLRQQWIADISHELRTPIAVLRSEIEIILDGIREPTPDRIQSLHTDVLSLAKLVEDLYQLSLSDSGEVILPDEPVDLIMTLYDAACAAEARLQEKSITIKQLNELEQQAQTQPVFISGDEERLYQIFSNLLANSYRYTDEDGCVVLIVQSHQARKKVKVIIQDSAPSVPDNALPRLFERLYRVDKSRSRAAGGSGLGLSIVQNIVTWHKGKIWAEHSPLGGLAICMEFPLIAKVD
jgi:two-component system sensor histidine kinase BaeS